MMRSQYHIELGDDRKRVYITGELAVSERDLDPVIDEVFHLISEAIADNYLDGEDLNLTVTGAGY